MSHDINGKALKVPSDFMRVALSSIVALVCLLLPISNFAATISVPPSAGGDGIQSALDGLGAGGEVVLSQGKYLVHAPIILRKDGQTLRGAGEATVLVLADGANCPVVILGSLTADAKNPTKGVHLSGLFIDGNRKNQPKEVWRILSDGAGVYNNGVDIWGTDNAEVDNVVCSHCRSGGMVTMAQTRRLTVRDYTAFDNQFDGLACYLTEESHFSHLNLHDNLAAAISLDLNFNHNVIQDAVLTGDDLGIFMRQSRDNVFEGVTIKQSHHHGVFMAETAVHTASGWQLSPGSECTGNTFSKLLIEHCGGKAFLVNDAGCGHNTICDGQFVDNTQGGLCQPAADLVTVRPSSEHHQALPAQVAFIK
jgi:nitrous oxidase accessory protein NosD